jgi:hypothetical protein
MHISSLSCGITRPSQLIKLDLMTLIFGKEYRQIIKLSLRIFVQLPATSLDYKNIYKH